MSEPYYTDGDVTLHHGDALAVAQAMPSRSVQTIVTSPPYFGLRDYGHEDQIGAEESPAEYVSNLVALFHELRRVLADDGTAWINLGDSYYSGRGASIGVDEKQSARRGFVRPLDKPGQPWAAPKNLLGIPWRVAFGLQDDGWILRSDIIWAKPNPMPESVTDRPTKAHEYVFLLAKSPRYYYDAASIAEPTAASSMARAGRGRDTDYVVPGQSRQSIANPPRFGGAKYGADDSEQTRTKSGGLYAAKETSNKRSVWSVPTTPFSAAHFAVYPPELIRPCILAGSRPGDTVLDPFSGSGTTGMVANYEGRKYVGIDLNADYLDLSLRTRFAAPALGMEAVS